MGLCLKALDDTRSIDDVIGLVKLFVFIIMFHRSRDKLHASVCVCPTAPTISQAIFRDE